MTSSARDIPRNTSSIMADGQDLRYTCFGFKNAIFQRINTVAWVVTCICMCNFAHCFVTQGLPGVLISTLERRFGLSSSQSSWIASAYEVATIPVLLALSFFGHKVHRPRMMAGGMLLVALGTVILVLPHFLSPPYAPLTEASGADSLCRSRTEDELCGGGEGEGQADSGLYPLLILGRVLHGAGCTPVFTLAVTYMDDIMERKRFSMMIGVFYSMAVLGPALGIMGGGSFLNIYTDFPADPPPGLTSASPHWIGAWWLPFVVGGLLCLIVAIPTAGYPRDMPGAAEIRRSRRSEAHGAGSVEDQTHKGIKTTMKGLLSNPPFLMVTAFIACDNFIILGFQAFGPKIMELLYLIDTSIAGAVLGAILLPAGLLGTLLGGALIEKLHLTCRHIIRIEAALTVGVIISLIALFANCTRGKFAGVTYPYDLSQPEILGNITSSCNIECMCESLTYEPVCSHDNVKYYSPCHAGCSSKVQHADKTEYYGCSCVTPNPEPSLPDATSVTCTKDSCPERALFLCSFFLITTMMFMCDSMNTSASVRLIKTSEKAMAVPMQWLIFCLMGTTPGPLAFGAVLDGACTLWSYVCGSRGSCLLYDNWSLGANLFFLVGGVKFVSLIFIGAAVLLYKPGSSIPVHEESGSSEDTTCAVPEVEEPEEDLLTVSNLLITFEKGLTGHTSVVKLGGRNSRTSNINSPTQQS